jgi:polyferredoxin
MEMRYVSRGQDSRWVWIGRSATQLLFLGLTAWTAYQMMTGVRGATIERYCPFGGIETLLPWIKGTGTLCSLSTLNISMMGGVLIVTLLLKRVFCSHICPVGTILEWMARLGRLLRLEMRPIAYRWDRVLKWLKYPLLIGILYLTIRAQELAFREVDPFYVLFTLGRGHGIADGVLGLGMIGVGIVAALFAVGLIVPLLFCRYLCPLAACLTPFSRIGLLRIHRDDQECTSCGLCDKACDWRVKVADVRTVTSGECSNCQECIRSCPVPGALALRIGGRGR